MIGGKEDTTRLGTKRANGVAGTAPRSPPRERQPMDLVITALSQIRAEMVTRDNLVDLFNEERETLETTGTRLRADLMQRMDRLQDGFTELQSEIAVNWGNTERVERKADSAHGELKSVKEMVSEMVRMMRRLESRVGALEEKR
jgi:hypothetical protein